MAQEFRWEPALVEAEITRLGARDFGYGAVVSVVTGSPNFPDPEVGDELYLLDRVVCPVKEKGMQVGDRVIVGVIPNNNPDAPQRFVGVSLQREESLGHEPEDAPPPAPALPSTRRLVVEVEIPAEFLRDASRWLAGALAEFGEDFPEATTCLRTLPA